MKIRALLIVMTVIGCAQGASAANTPPLSQAWNIASSGTASSSGELLFRVTPGDGGDAEEITVSVSSGTNEMGVAGNIRRTLGTQLRGSGFNNRISSVVVRAGVWRLCEAPNFQGRCLTVTGDIANLGGFFNDRISSIQLLHW